MAKKIVFILFLLLFLPFFANADEAAKIELNLNKQEVGVGEEFQLSVELKNASTGNLQIGNFDIPGIENFSQRGSSQSTKVQMINGATTAVNETILTLIPTQKGEFEIGPVEINTGALSVKSNTVKITVNEAKKKSFFDNQQSGGLVSKKKTNDKNFSFDTVINLGALILLVALVYYVYRQKQGTGKITEDEDSAENEDLNNINIPQIDDDDFFKNIKEQLLLLLQRKHKIDTEILTTREIIEELNKKNIYGSRDIGKALELCDLGSFAKNESNKEELINIIKNIK